MEDKNNKLTNIALRNLGHKPIEETITKAKQERSISEINNILNETPIGDGKSKKKLKDKKTKLPKFFSNKRFKYWMIGLGIIILLLLILPSNPDCPTITNKTVTSVKGEISFDLIKEQIINQGYTEITDGSSTIKLAPYLK